MRRRSGCQEDLVVRHPPRTCSSRLIKQDHNFTALAADLDKCVLRALGDFDSHRGLAHLVQARHLEATTLHLACHRQDTYPVYCLRCRRRVVALRQVDLQASTVVEIGRRLANLNRCVAKVAALEATVRLHHSQEGSYLVHQEYFMAIPRAAACHSTGFDRTLAASNSS